MVPEVSDRVTAAIEAERTTEADIGTAADGKAVRRAPDQRVGKRSAPVKGRVAASVPPLSSSVAGPKAELLLAMKAATGQVQRAAGEVVGDHQGAAVGRKVRQGSVVGAG